MKKFALLILSVALFTACSEDTAIEDQVQLDDMPFVEADLSKMLPAPSFDTTAEGIYAGVISTEALNFHAKVWINAGNDGSFYAIARSSEEKVRFDLKKRDGDVFVFANDRGAFTFDASDPLNAVITKADMDGSNANITVRKEVGGAKFGIILGEYTTGVNEVVRGTWDYLIAAPTGADFVEELIIQKPAPFFGTKIERASDGDFEAGVTGCYGPDPILPFFLSSTTPAAPTDAEIELYMVGQTVDFGNGQSVLFDFGFSKFICDNNALDYNRMLANPVLTGDFVGITPTGGCNNITAGGPPLQGIYVELASDGTTVLTVGLIRIDTSSFVPVIPPPGFEESGIPEYDISDLKF